MISYYTGVSLAICLSVSLSLCLSVSLSVSVCLCLSLSVRPSVRRAVLAQLLGVLGAILKLTMSSHFAQLLVQVPI